MKKSLGFKSYLLCRLKIFVPTTILLKIYVTYALLVIDYCDILYNGANVDVLNELQRLQNRCLKFCLKKSVLTSTDYIHQEVKLPMLAERRTYHARVYGFKRSQQMSFCRHINLNIIGQPELIGFQF